MSTSALIWIGLILTVPACTRGPQPSQTTRSSETTTAPAKAPTESISPAPSSTTQVTPAGSKTELGVTPLPPMLSTSESREGTPDPNGRISLAGGATKPPPAPPVDAQQPRRKGSATASGAEMTYSGAGVPAPPTPPEIDPNTPRP